MKKERQVSTDKQTERFFFICNLTSTYYPIQMVGSYVMSEGLVALIPEYYSPIREIGSSRAAEFTYPVAGKEGTNRKTTTEGKEYKKIAEEIVRESITVTGIKIDRLFRRALTTQAQYIGINYKPPVYVEDGSIIAESEQMEALKPYRVILDNVRHIVVKNQKGDVDIYDCPPD